VSIESVTIEEMVQCVKREIGFRKQVFPRRVQLGSMSQQEMDKEILQMTAILEKLKAEVPNLFNNVNS